MYQRDDIYWCECCGEFYAEKTDQKVDVDLSEMSTEFAARITKRRAELAKKKRRSHNRR